MRPLWSRDGRELFFLARTARLLRVIMVAIARGHTFSAGTPRQLFEGPFYAGAGVPRPYDVSPDGKRFLMIKNLAAESTTSTDVPLVRVLNFFDELKRLAPTKR